ncbi:hypothetical protein L345_17992, partial [Ophiophagus hannah]
NLAFIKHVAPQSRFKPFVQGSKQAASLLPGEALRSMGWALGSQRGRTSTVGGKALTWCPSSLFCQELLQNLNLGGHKSTVSSLAVVLSLEGKASHRELTSRLLSDLVGKVLSAEDIAAAFDGMLHDLPDLILDTPEAPQMLGQFIARAVADHALPLNFLERYKGRVDCEHARAALDRAAVLLRIKRDVNRLDNVWGVGGGQRPVKHLIK